MIVTLWPVCEMPVLSATCRHGYGTLYSLHTLLYTTLLSTPYTPACIVSCAIFTGGEIQTTPTDFLLFESYLYPLQNQAL